MTYRVPEAMLERFRRLSLERLARIEATWASLLEGLIDAPAFDQLLRDLHTLKGDASVIGYLEIHTLGHKLEELMATAHEHRDHLPEDFELVVTMAIQFLGILLRQKPGSPLSGIDLDGFVRQVDEILHETHTLPVRLRTTAGRIAAETGLDRLAEATRRKLSIAATTTYLEAVAARSPVSRARLRGVWETLRGELARMQATQLAPLVERHASAGRHLATELGKLAAIRVDAGEIRVDSRVAEAVDLAVLHLVRNAIDHGIEAPATRARAGKPEQGAVEIRARDAHGAIELVVADDGAGVELAAVREKAIRRGVLDAERAARATDAELIDLLFLPGFTTRTQATAISGRGVGLDAVKDAIVRVGGTVTLRTTPGAGSAIALAIPTIARQIAAFQFPAADGGLQLAIAASWDVAGVPAAQAQAGDAGPDIIDPIAALQLPGHDGPRRAPAACVRLRRGFFDLCLGAGGPPQPVTAERICPTPDDHPVEIALVDGKETILIRPENVVDLLASARYAATPS